MEQHPVPRQITTFEFKLVGFMTIKQFGFVLLAGVFGYGMFLIVPIFIFNYIVGITIFCIGLAFAFIPVNDRSLDVFIKNLWSRLNSPTQYIFKKNNPPVSLINDLYFETNPHITLAHIDSREKLENYLSTKKSTPKEDLERESAIGRINTVIQSKPNTNKLTKTVPRPPLEQTERTIQTPQSTPASKSEELNSPELVAKHPFFSGTVINSRNIPLPGILIYIKDLQNNSSLRILKTNPHGVFATFHPLPPGKYKIEIADSSENYQFDSKVVELGRVGQVPVTFASKELL